MFEEIALGINVLADGAAAQSVVNEEGLSEYTQHKIEKHELKRADCCMTGGEISGESGIPQPQPNDEANTSKDFGMLGVNVDNGVMCSLPDSPTILDFVPDCNEVVAHSAVYESTKSNLLASPVLEPPIDHATTQTSKLTNAADPTVDYSMSAGDYRLEQAIGYGSSAVVHLATYLPTGASVAVKIIDLDRFERNQIDTLRREIQVMSLCRHPNLLRVLASFVNESQLWIVTPFLAAGSCLDLLRTPQFHLGVCDETAIATILVQALQGLEYLHANGHIHRDIKAGNLLVDLDGQVQLADFGVSSSLLDNAGGRQGDIRKTFVGTPCWMAPEVMEMTKGYDAKADIWSFGITAYELATGSAPFAKLPPMKVIYMTLQNDPPKLNRHREGNVKFSRAFKDMIALCLQKDPGKRPTAEALLKHSFFKQARKHEYVAQVLLVDMRPIQERAKANPKVAQRRLASTKTTSSLKHESIPEEDWDFSSSESEGDCNDNDTPANPNEAAVDKRGRFVVGPNQALSPTSAAEENQASINSAAENDAGSGGIKKGRFCVNAATATATANGSSAASPKMQDAAHSPGVQSPPTEADEEGRKSRFEILPNAAAASAEYGHGKSDEAKVSFSEEPHLYRPQPQHHHQPQQMQSMHLHNHHHHHQQQQKAAAHSLQASSSMLPEYAQPPPSFTMQPGMLLLSSSQVDHLLFLNDLVRSQLLEMRMGAARPYLPHYPPSYDHHLYQNHNPHPIHSYGLSSLNPCSPITSPHASQADLGLHGKSMTDFATDASSNEGLGYRSSYYGHPQQNQRRGQTAMPNDPVLAVERQLVMLRLENEQLRRRYQH